MKKLSLFILVTVTLSAGFFCDTSTTHAALPAGFEIETLATGLNIPTSIAFVPDGRTFIAEKGGAVRVLKNGALLTAPLLTLSDVNTYGDRGLLGIAVDPNFAVNGYVYLLYTYENTPGFNFAASKTGRIARVTVTGDTSDETTKVVILGSVGGNIATPSCDDYVIGTDCIPSDSPSHTVAALRFGPDGKLYASMGDGSSFDYADQRSLRAQNIDVLAGKILRINTDGSAPTDNPFYNGNPNANRSKVFSLGLRNPFRFNFRPSNGSLFVGDVGWSNWEEVNVAKRGANYGWPCREGAGTTANGLGCTAVSSTSDPLYFYAHDSNGAGSVTGGTFSTGTAYPAAFTNSYFFGDYAQNFIKRIEVDANNNLLSVQPFATDVDGTDGPVEFVTGPEGNIYFIGIYTGSLKRITYTLGNRQPITVMQVTPTSGVTPLIVTFSAVGSSDPDGNPLSYLWNFGDGATSSAISPAHTYTSGGLYTSTLTVTDGQGGSSIKSALITAGNQAPAVTISNPASGALYSPGDVIQLSGSGNDPETGLLAGSALRWEIIIHHNVHTHLYQTLTGANPTFIGPDHSDPDVYVEIRLIATDPAGLTSTKSVNMYLNNGTGASNPILNPSLETPSENNPNTPESWLKGGYGVNNAIFTYPVAGYDGTKAAKLEVNNYTDGDAKWVFSPVYVSESTVYHFSDYYTSTVTSRLSVQVGYADGTYSYINLGTTPASTAWKKFEATFTTPANARTLTVFHSLSGVGVLTIDAFNLSTNVAPVDTVAPTVVLTSPVASSTLSGTVLLTATATDAVGVTHLWFLLDGVATGTELTAAPYQLSIDTTKLSNGPHTFAVQAHDAAENMATSATVPVTISNVEVSTPLAPNRIVNGSLEVLSTTSAGVPQGWKTGKYGTNQTVFTYPTPGATGNGIKVAMTQRTSGDAKWYFNEVPVSGGQVYDLSLSYRSNATSSISLRYLTSSSTYTYPILATTVSPSATWKKMTYRFTVPAGVVSLTAFQALNRVGFIENDEFSLRIVDTVAPAITLTSPTSGATTSGSISLSASATDAGGVANVQFAIDGVNVGAALSAAPYVMTFDTATLANGVHTVRAVARDIAGNAATTTSRSFTIANTPATTTPTNLIQNGSLETANGQVPLGWSPGGWGSNTRTFTYPVLGRDGGKAAQLDVTNYVDGDIKWIFNAVPVSVGTVYTYSQWYKGTTISDVIGEYKMADGSLYYFGLIKENAPTSTWTQITSTFSPPVGAVSLTIFDLISENGTLIIDDVQLYAVGTTTPVTDITPPQVSITSPLAAGTVSGVVTLVASSSDNVGVTGVMFAIDGTPISPLVTTAPYTFVWNSASVANGVHTIKATTHDAVGNNNTDTISVTVSNSGTGTTTATTTSQNLIENPGVETAGVNGTPVQWFKGGWGTNTSVLSYPVAGMTSAKGVKVSVTNYTNGDAKWYFAPKTVIAGNVYTYSHWYTADATSTVTVRYTLADGTFTYTEWNTLPAQTAWTQYIKAVTVPANAVALTVFHSLRSVGTLTTDDFILAPQTVPTDPTLFATGMVSLTFDDGWLSHYTNVLPILNVANLKGSFGIVSLETLDALPTNRVENASFETNTAGQPTDWFHGGWGNNDAVFSYEPTGRTGSQSAKISITTYTDGDAKWFFKDTTVVDGQLYSYSDYYQSDVATIVTARYSMGSSTYVYADLDVVPPAATWTKYEKQFNMPANVESFTVFHRLASVGTLSIDDANFARVQIFVSPAQVLAMQSAQHEIASHSRTHPSLPNILNGDMLDEVNNSKTDLTGMGVTKVNTFIYPYGDYSAGVEQALSAAGYIGARSVDRGYNDKTTNKFELKTQQVDVNTTLDQIKSWIDTAVQNKTWLTLMFHQVDMGGLALTTTPEILQGAVDYLKLKNTPVVTLEEGIAQMNP